MLPDASDPGNPVYENGDGVRERKRERDEDAASDGGLSFSAPAMQGNSQGINRPDSFEGVLLRPKVRHISATVAPSFPANNGRMRRTFSSNEMRPQTPVTPAPSISFIPNPTISRNGNMMLQLVLPPNLQNDVSMENGGYFNTVNDAVNNLIRRNNRSSYAENQQQDHYSSLPPFPQNGTPHYINQAYSSGDLLDFQRQDNSTPQTPMTYRGSDVHLIKETPPEEKKRLFREYFTIILSCIYAVFIVTLGLVIYITDAVVGNSPIAETFSLILVIIAFVYLLYLIIDIRIFINKRNKFHNLLEQTQTAAELRQSPDGNLQLNIALPEAVKIRQPLPHHYCLSKDRHSGNFYLKIGAAGFCLGHLIHSGLLLGYQIVFLTSDGENFYECASIATLVLDFIYPIYSFLLLYFIFKYSNVIINKHIPLARFGIMHCISSSLCFWVWTIIRETLESLVVYDDDDEEEKERVQRIGEASFYGEVSTGRSGMEGLKDYFNEHTRVFTKGCESDKGLRLIYQNFSPYLYPFSVEYSILVAGVLFIIWKSVGSCEDSGTSEEETTPTTNHCDTPTAAAGGGGGGDNLESNIVLHADCHAANKGLFGGIIVLVLCVVSIILFFIAISDERYQNHAALINGITEVIILIVMAISAIFAYRQLTKLDHNYHPHSLLDDLLLFICIPAFFVNAIFSMVPAVEFGHPRSIILILLQLTQVLTQTPMIIDGLRRCSNSKELRRKKPGREVLTFLIVCNVAMWITQTFEIKSHDVKDERYEFYGKVLWSIIGHLCLPLMMFYRFHSSVCIVDIWKYAYEKAGH